MKCTKIDDNVQSALHNVLVKEPLVQHIAQEINAYNGRTLLVGGAVRDLLLGIPLKDLDIEVHGLSLDTLESILKKFGPVSLVGKAYGVLRLHGLDIDWSIPRTDASGRKPEVTINPNIAIKDAFERRDLTINAMGIDLITLELIDPFNGYNDLKQGILRAPNPQKFIEDPLRFYRVMQFMSRFHMQPDTELEQLCKPMDISTVSVERIDEEFKKLLLRSAQPSLGIRWLKDIGRLKEILPELYKTIDVPQEYKWHPEGDVFEHSMQALDAAAQLDYDNEQEKLIILYAALCHDLGKVTTTQFINGAYHSYGHEHESEKLAKKMLPRITRNKELIHTVAKLAKFHMVPPQLVKSNARDVSYKRLAGKLAPNVTLAMLAKLSLADRRGRNGEKFKPLTHEIPEITTFLEKAEKAQVLHQQEQPVLQGRDIIDAVTPGPKMGKLLDSAYKIQLEEGITDKEVLKARVIKHKK